jgi:hypothetical protein
LSAVPVIGSEEYHANPEQYRVQRQTIIDLYRDAEVVALMTIPDDVRAIYDQIEQEHRRLLRLEVG